MKNALTFILYHTFRLLIKLRYRVRADGLADLPRERGVLILPNHPAEIDPVIVETLLWSYRPRPVIIEDFYHVPVLHTLLRLLDAIPMPNQSLGTGTFKRLRVQEGIDRVTESLAQGRSILLYPSGAIMRTGLENLRGTSAVTEILKAHPDVPIVLVRTRGLVGSSFSWMMHRRRPELMRWGGHALRRIVQSLVFFVPKRPVHVECIAAPPDFPRRADKLTINAWLEDWYNAHGEEPISQISYSCWGNAQLDIVPPPEGNRLDTAAVDVPPEIRTQVTKELARRLARPPAEIKLEARLSQELGMDSLDLADLVTWLEEKYYVTDVEAADLGTGHDVIAAAAGMLKGEAAGDGPPPVPEAWHAARPESIWVTANLTDPLHRQFLDICDSAPGAVAFADEMSGVLTYRRAKIATVLLAEVIHKEPEKYIGIMLPASAGANLLIMATLLAGKVPVMINWTLGMTNMKHVLEIAGCKVIYTSGRFLDRLDDLDVDFLRPYLRPLEEIRRSQITVTDKLRALWRSRKSAVALERRFNDDAVSVHDPAVILFTSGSEARPKGVPLTHLNILANITGSLAAVPVGADDTIMGFLPPFHSFGFTATVVMPMITGMKAFYHPNPTQSRKIASLIADWKPTIICGTPTFIAGIMGSGGDGKVASLRLILAGAERVPDDLFSKVEIECGATLLEGYGITECSAALTINRAGAPRAGVGRAIGDVEIRIVDLDTRQPVATGNEGLILVRGASVFNGYLVRDSSSAFHVENGDSWYITGDLGHIDDDGNLTISGRLKRFIKVGGEMISLQAVETAIADTYPDMNDEQGLALTYLEKEGERPVLGLFTTFETTVDAVNTTLKEAGFSNLVRIQRIQVIDEIPLLGTGKTDYRTLTQTLQDAIAEA